MNSAYNEDKLTLTVFSRANNPYGEKKEITFEDLPEFFSPKPGEKDGPGFSAARFKNNHRGKGNHNSTTMIVLDVEANKETGEVPPSIEEISRRLKKQGFRFILYTTYKHTDESPRYRIIIFLSAPIIFSDDKVIRRFEQEVGREAALIVAEMLQIAGVVDRSKLGGESLFFLPRHPPGGEKYAKIVMMDGNLLATSDLLREAQQRVAARNMETQVSKNERLSTNQPQSNNGLISQLRPKLPPLRELLRQNGYKHFPDTDRWLHPNSSSGVPGVVVFDSSDGVERCLSYHESDPLGGDKTVFGARAHDSLDIVIAHRFGTSKEDFSRGLKVLADENGIERKASSSTPFLERYPLSASISAPDQARFSVSSFDYGSMFKVQPREKLYGTHLYAGYLSATVAPGGMGKTSHLLAEAGDMATGGKVFGIAHKAIGVLYWNGEDPYDELVRRVAGICKEYNITEEDLGGRLFLSSGRTNPLIIGTETREGVQISTPIIDKLKAEILKHNIRVVVIDPFVSCHQVDENNNGKIDQIAKSLSQLAEETACAFEIVHHVRKLGPDVEMTANDSRGASSLTAASRSVRVFNRAKESDMANLIRPGEVANPRSYYRIVNDKMNMAPPSDKSDWFKIISVELDNGTPLRAGDSVGVVRRADKISPFETLTTAHLKRFQCVLMDAGDNGLAYNQQAFDWAGYELAQILGWDADTKDGKRRLKQIIEQYLSNKVIQKRRVKKPGKAATQERLFCGDTD